MNFLDFFKAAPVRNQSDAPASPSISWNGLKRPVISYEHAIAAEMALSHPVVFRCLSKIATSVQTVDWYAEPDSSLPESERASVKEIKTLNALLRSPNDNLGEEQLRYWMALNYAVYGRIPFKVGVSTTGMANGIYPLDARYFRVKTTNRGSITEYEYGSENRKEVMYSRKFSKKSSNNSSYAHEIFIPSLNGELSHDLTPTTLSAIGLPSQVIRLLLQRSVETASGHPNSKYVISTQKTLTNQQKRALVEKIEGYETGEDDSGNILFFYNTDIKVDKLDNDLSDIHSRVPLGDMAKMIAGAFGIPNALIGIDGSDGAKFASNYDESRKSFFEDTVIPCYLSPIENGLTTALCPPGAVIKFDRDTIPALQQSRVAKAKNLNEVTFLTINEKRELAGYEPLTEKQIAELERHNMIANTSTTQPSGSST